MNEAGTSCVGSLSDRCPVGEWHRRSHHQKTARTEWSKEKDEAAMECYIFSRLFDEKGKPITGHRKQMHGIWKERQGLKVTKQRLCDQAGMIRINGWLTELEMKVIKKRMINENAHKNNHNTGSDDDDDQSEATKNK